ncbi:MAG: hypothetical protein WAR82_02005 [Leptotrichiaceae bacterium]|nr:hypothetical protein [Leptotrichiaceae bacterium]MBP9876434.1 hypothetical protein [Leptotrichiaceae bacterium]
MKKLLLVIGILMLGSFMKAESLDDSLDAVSVSLEISFYSQVFVSSLDLSAQSSESSDTETNRREREKEKQKEKIQSLINKKDVKAEELFSAQGLKTYNLNANDKITLENTAAGVVVGKSKETVAVIVMDEKFDNLTSREKHL